MKNTLLYIMLVLLSCMFAPLCIHAQDSSTTNSQITIIKDARLDVLAKKEAELNAAAALAAQKTAKGYRLMLLSTNDRNIAMKVRQQLLQHFPDQKVYMGFQPPNIKLKFGNFLDRNDAEKMKNDIIKLNIISTNIYIVPEMIEVKPDKNKDKQPADANTKP